jgi:hypothetical protein
MIPTSPRAIAIAVLPLVIGILLLNGCPRQQHEPTRASAANYVPDNTFDRIKPGETDIVVGEGDARRTVDEGEGRRLRMRSGSTATPEVKEGSGAIFPDLFGGTDKKERQAQRLRRVQGRRRHEQVALVAPATVAPSFLKQCGSSGGI